MPAFLLLLRGLVERIPNMSRCIPPFAIEVPVVGFLLKLILFLQDVVSYLEPHLRGVQLSRTNSETEAHSRRSMLQASDLERIVASGRHSGVLLRSMRFMTTVPLHTPATSFVSASSTEVDATGIASTLLPR